MLIDEQPDDRVEVFLRVLLAIVIDPFAQIIDIGARDDIWAVEDVGIVRAYESQHPCLIGLAFDRLARAPGGTGHPSITQRDVGLSVCGCQPRTQDDNETPRRNACYGRSHDLLHWMVISNIRWLPGR